MYQVFACLLRWAKQIVKQIVFLFVRVYVYVCLTVCLRKNWEITHQKLMKLGVNVCYCEPKKWLTSRDIWPLTLRASFVFSFKKTAIITWKLLVRFYNNSFIENCNHKAVGYINTIRSKKSKYEQTNIKIHSNIDSDAIIHAIIFIWLFNKIDLDLWSL